MASADTQVLDYSNTARKVLQVEGWSQRYAYNGDGLVEYQGFANPGESISSTSWSIKKYVYSGNSVIQVLWASSAAGKFSHIWSGVAAVSTTHADYNYA